MYVTTGSKVCQHTVNWSKSLRYPCKTLLLSVHYRPQRSCGKVLFSQASVILFTGGGVSARHPLGRQPPTFPGQTPTRQTPLPHADTPLGRQTPHLPPGQTPFPRADTPPRRWLLQRTVRILLECILVLQISSSFAYDRYCLLVTTAILEFSGEEVNFNVCQTECSHDFNLALGIRTLPQAITRLIPTCNLKL